MTFCLTVTSWTQDVHQLLQAGDLVTSRCLLQSLHSLQLCARISVPEFSAAVHFPAAYSDWLCFLWVVSVVSTEPCLFDLF